MSKIRTVVCGTSFGRFYIEGIKSLNDQYELVGILSTGSRQSKRIAEKENIKLYTDVNEINREEVDLACVVIRSNIVGGKGSEIAEAFLEKGIHVVQEQPIHVEDMKKCYMLSKKNNCKYFVEMFYSNVSTPAKFISIAKKLCEKTKPIYLDVSCSLQVLLPTIDIVGRILGGFSPWEMKEDSLKDIGMFSQISGFVKGVPCEIKVQNELNADDPDNYVHLLQRMTLYTESGSLSMTEAHGEIIWNPCYLVPRDAEGVLDPYQDETVLKTVLNDSYGYQNRINIQNLFEKEWSEAISTYLTDIYENVSENTENKAIQQHNLMCAKYWNEVGRLIGKSRPAKESKIIQLSLDDLV